MEPNAVFNSRGPVAWEDVEAEQAPQKMPEHGDICPKVKGLRREQRLGMVKGWPGPTLLQLEPGGPFTRSAASAKGQSKLDIF